MLPLIGSTLGFRKLYKIIIVTLLHFLNASWYAHRAVHHILLITAFLKQTMQRKIVHTSENKSCSYQDTKTQGSLYMVCTFSHFLTFSKASLIPGKNPMLFLVLGPQIDLSFDNFSLIFLWKMDFFDEIFNKWLHIAEIKL